jgi:hypothetical protein
MAVLNAGRFRDGQCLKTSHRFVAKCYKSQLVSCIMCEMARLSRLHNCGTFLPVMLGDPLRDCLLKRRASSAPSLEERIDAKHKANEGHCY